MINYILFSERKKLADEYEEWVNKPLEDGSKIKDCALSVVTFMTSKGYRKIPEGAVVLTEEEYKKLKHGSGTLEKLYNQYPFRVLVGFNSMVFCQDRECFERLYDEIEERASKETAEKFAERLKKRFEKSREYYSIDTGTAWSGGCIGGLINDKIDEICKEIKDNVFRKGGDENAERYDCEL